MEHYLEVIQQQVVQQDVLELHGEMFLLDIQIQPIYHLQLPIQVHVLLKRESVQLEHCLEHIQILHVQ